jgi:hypothetical protein
MKTLLLMLAGAAAMIAQNAANAPPHELFEGEVIRVVEVKSPANVIYNSLGKLFPGISMVNENRLLVRGPVAVVDMIEEAIKKLDAPSPDVTPNVELTLQLLQGYAQEGAGGPIPSDLESTVRQLRALFPYKSYKVLDTEIFRAKSGKYGDLSGTLPGSAQTFLFYVAPTVNAGKAPRSIHLGSLRLSFQRRLVVDGKTQGENWGINTSVDAVEGQKTVVGKANILGSEDAIILVVTPRIE